MAPATSSPCGGTPTRTRAPGRSPKSVRPGGRHPNGPSELNLASLLVDHPFADDEPLLCTIAGCVTAGEARTRAADVGERVRAHGLLEGRAAAVQLPNDPGAVIAMF